MGSRSTSLEDRENFPEGPVAPFHHSTDMGDPGGRTKSVIRILARTLKFPRASTPSSTLGFERERGDLSEFLEEYPQMEGGIGPPQGESMGLSELSDGIP
jgi:hypothetical protein